MWHGWGKGEVKTGDLLRRSEGKRPLGRPRRRCKDNIKMYLYELGRGMDWTDLA
jgi:hypothetical protein